jgi:hypothetical protein
MKAIHLFAALAAAGPLFWSPLLPAQQPAAPAAS